MEGELCVLFTNRGKTPQHYFVDPWAVEGYVEPQSTLRVLFKVELPAGQESKKDLDVRVLTEQKEGDFLTIEDYSGAELVGIWIDGELVF